MDGEIEAPLSSKLPKTSVSALISRGIATRCTRRERDALSERHAPRLKRGRQAVENGPKGARWSASIAWAVRWPQ